MPSKTIIIIGGGTAGLVAAYTCLKQGYIPLLFESQNRLGGNVYSVNIAGKNIDLGVIQAWDWYLNVIDIAKELGIGSLIRPTTNLLIRKDRDTMTSNTSSSWEVIDRIQETKCRADVKTSEIYPHHSSNVNGNRGNDEKVNLCHEMTRMYEWRFGIMGAPIKELWSMASNKLLSLVDEPLSTFSFYNPQPSVNFPAHFTIAKWMEDLPQLSNQSRITFHGYLFGDVTEVPAYTILNTMIRSSTEWSFGDKGMCTFTNALVDFLIQGGARIYLNHKVHSIDLTNRVMILQKMSSTSSASPPFSLSYDHVIVACNPLSMTMFNATEVFTSPAPITTSPLSTTPTTTTTNNRQSSISGLSSGSLVNPYTSTPQLRYTKAIAVAIEIEEPLAYYGRPQKETNSDIDIDGTKTHWDFAFERLDESKPFELVGTMNLTKLDLPRHIVLLFVVRSKDVPGGWSLEDLQRNPNPLLYYIHSSDLLKCNGVRVLRVCDSHTFYESMPVWNEAFQEKIRRMREANLGFGFAGQWTGAHPSLEFATYSGRLAALEATNPEEAKRFKEHWDKIDMETAANIQNQIKSIYTGMNQVKGMFWSGVKDLFNRIFSSE